MSRTKITLLESCDQDQICWAIYKKQNMVGSDGSAVDEGNTNSSSTINAVKRQNGAKRWTFTWNNYSQNWVALLAPVFEGCTFGIGSEEVGESGTPHIQGYVEFASKVRPIGYRGCPKEVHWGDDKGKPARGTRLQNVMYCRKQNLLWFSGPDANDEERRPHTEYFGTERWRPPRDLPKIELRGWQEEVRRLAEAPVQQRKIYWFWSSRRGIGKSDAVRWLATEGALVTGGGAKDMKYLICKYKEKNGDYPETIAMDVPCSMQGFVSYAGIEEVVNGVFASTKYECEPVIMPYARFFLFANFPPALDNVDMSANRFVVFDIDEWMARWPEGRPMDALVEQKKRDREYTDEQLLDF